MKVRSNGTYLYQPCLWDLVDPKTPLTANALVTVVKLDGCPPPNTMGHAHIADMQGQFLGLVSTTSLHELTAQQKAASNRAKRKANGGRFMTGAEISELIDLQGKCSYNLPNKQLFRKLATKLLREVAVLIDDDAEVGYNEAGVACSGDAILHGDHIYVNFNADGSTSRLGIMYRTCKGKKDYTGGMNNWFPHQRLAANGAAGLARAILDLIDPRHECPRCCKTNTELREKQTQVFCRDCNQATLTLGDRPVRD